MKYKISQTILGLLLIFGAYHSHADSSVDEVAGKPNILFIFADDQTWNTLSSIEECEVKTPNLDRLRENGVWFTHAYNQGSFAAAVCVASRTMLNTGSFLWRAASYMPESREVVIKSNDPAQPDPYIIQKRKPEAFWSEWMKEAGYETYFAGKWHVPGVSPSSIFDHCVNIRGGMPKQTAQRYDRTFSKDDQDHWSPYNQSLGGYWDGGKHWSEVLGDDGVEYLHHAKNNSQPFFMYLAFNAPHDPRQSPKRFVDLYPAEDIEVPPNFLPEYPYNEDVGAGRGLRDERLAPFPRTEFSVKVNRQEYFAIVSHMDEQIGRILDTLEATNQQQNTYIIFTADHGIAVGDHGFLGKQNMYDSSMRVPLLIVGPEINQGETVDAQVYLQDVMATALDIAGVDKSDQVEFHSLLSLAKGATRDSAYDAIYGAYYGLQRMIRTEQYKMIIYPKAGVVRLYDVIEDPHEIHDLAQGKDKPKELMKSLFVEFTQLQREMGDPIDVATTFYSFIEE